MRRIVPYLLPFLAGLAVGGVILSGGGKQRRVGAESVPEILVDVPHPESDWRRIRHPLAVYRITHPDGEATDLAAAPLTTREWRVRVAGTTYHGVPRE